MSDDAIPQGGPQLAAWVDRELQALGELESQVEDIRETARLRIQDFQQWEEQEVAKKAGDIAFRTARLTEIAKSFPYAGRSKSVQLPFGVIGTRVQPLSVEIRDPAKALRFAKDCGLAVAVSLSTRDPEDARRMRIFARDTGLKVEEQVGKEALNAYATEQRKADPTWKPHALDDGFEIHGGEPKPYVVTTRKAE